ncbi:MAG: glycosyltransferase family 2 protein [Lachnospiraceae bacterium]|nr:glycosyltransferase family 2 protein [Lachnospiraceae bacterium]MBP5254018.1 glycosyltransferase family 2 protein [Lachnospiraceae bacterium]
MDLSFVIPCYNEEGNIRPVYEAIRDVFAPSGISYEVVMVNDGSKDGTWKAIRALAEEYPDDALTAVCFSRNFGKEAAILAGLRHTKGDAVCLIDADLQQRPETALTMYRKLRSDPEYDCVAAYQDARKEGPVLKFFKDCFYRLINRLCDIDFIAGASDFRVFRRNMADAILSLPEYHRFSKGIFSWVGFETYYMPYEADERLTGKSKWSFWSLVKYALEGIVGYSTKPLQFATVTGMLLSVIAIVYMVVLVVKTLILGIDVPGYVTTLGFVLLLGGIQLLMLGIIGEYLSKVYVQGKNRPVYIEKEVIERETDGENRE